MPIEMIKTGWAYEQEVMALKAVLFGADGVIPVQRLRCQRSQDQQQVVSSENSGSQGSISLPNDDCCLLTIYYVPRTPS